MLTRRTTAEGTGLVESPRETWLAVESNASQAARVRRHPWSKQDTE